MDLLAMWELLEICGHGLKKLNRSNKPVFQSRSDTFRICVLTKGRGKLIGVDERNAAEIECRIRKIKVSITGISGRQKMED